MPNQKAQDNAAERVKSAFDAMDKDGSGQVTMCEFRDYCKQVPGMDKLAEAFCSIDTSDDCRISLDELMDLCLNKVPPGKIEEQHVCDLFKKLDTSGDGKLDREEFRALLCDCGYNESTIQGTIEHVAGADGKVTLDEFLHHWQHDC